MNIPESAKKYVNKFFRLNYQESKSIYFGLKEEGNYDEDDIFSMPNDLVVFVHGEIKPLELSKPKKVVNKIRTMGMEEKKYYDFINDFEGCAKLFIKSVFEDGINK